MVAVMAGADRIARPAVGIGRARKPGDRKVERVADRAGHTKMEPLIEIGLAILADGKTRRIALRSEEHTSELQSLMRTSYAVFCLKKKQKTLHKKTNNSIIRQADYK